MDLLRELTTKVVTAPSGKALAIHAGHIYTAKPEATTLENDKVIIVIDGAIDSVVTESQFVPTEGLIELDARHLTVMPGMIETHTHVTGEWVHAPHDTHLEPFPETRVLRGLLDAWAVLTAGFTTMFSMGHGHPNFVSAIRTMIDQEHLPGPRIFHCGWALSQTAGHGTIRDWNYDVVSQLRPRSAFADGPWQLRNIVRENLGKGADFIKIYAGEGGYTAPPHIARRLDFSPEEIQAVTDEAHRMGFRVAAHCMSIAHVRHAVENGVDRIEHGPVGYEPDFVPLLKEHGAGWCPTLSQLQWALDEREQRKLSDDMITKIERGLDGRCQMIAEALAEGVTVGFGTDNRMRPKAGQNAREFTAMVDRGIPTSDALAIATRHAAKLTGLEDSLGTIEPGKVADLLAIDGDPISDISVLTDATRIRHIVQSEIPVLPAEIGA